MIEKTCSMGSTGEQNSKLQHEAPMTTCLLRIIQQTTSEEGCRPVSEPGPMDRAEPAEFFLMYTAVDWGVLKKGLGSWA